MQQANITPFFDADTFTWSYVVADPATSRAAVIDAVYDYDPASGRLSSDSAERILAHIHDNGLTVDWFLETHAHADHLSASSYLKSELGCGAIAIGEHIREVQAVFAAYFNIADQMLCDGSQFDRLFADGEVFAIGELEVRVLHTPGHTPACVTYVIDDAAFVGDTLFMPDYGTARTDFPGGDATTLFRSIQRLYELPPSTRLFMCHDYLSGDRSEYAFETSVADERKSNVHVADGVSEAAFVAAREARDAQLPPPRLLLPSVQFNIRAGQLPPAEANGSSYFKIPLKVA